MMVKLESEDCGDGWVGEYDSLPLKERLKLLRSRKQASDSVDLKETVVRGQCGAVTRSSIVNGEEDGSFNSEEDNTLPGEDHKGAVFDAKKSDLQCFQTSDCGLNDISSPTSSGCHGFSQGDCGCREICMTSSSSSSEVPSNDRSAGSNLTVSTLQHRALSKVSPKAENEHDNETLTFSLKGSMSSNSASMQGAKVKDDISNGLDDNLENIVLSKRRQMLLSRLTGKSQKPCMQAYPVAMPKSYLFSGDAVHESVLTGIPQSHGGHLMAGNLRSAKIDYDFCFGSNASKSEIAGMSFAINQSSAPSLDNIHYAESVEAKSSTSSDSKLYDTQETLRSKALPSSIKIKVEPQLYDELDGGEKHVTENLTGSGLPVKRELRVIDGAAEDDSDHLPLTDGVKLPPARTSSSSISRDLNYPNKVPSAVKLAIGHPESVKLLSLESSETGPSSLIQHKPSDRQEKLKNNPKTVSSLPSPIRVKTEPVRSNEIDNGENTYKGKSSPSNLLPVKTEPTFSAEISEDKLDHMSLLDRLMLLSSETSSSLEAIKDLRCPSGNASSNLALGLDILESIEPISVIRPRKRRRTATNSAETALEEDAPELLKVLVEKGVSIEEIKLYGEPESNEVIDEAFCEDSFDELEAIIWKVFSHREPLLKLAPICCSKGSKVTYCLGCLLSLVEQTRYLKNRKWPVEWGWCRDLQAFIFVFQRHNRIVLERPEYGYATYFFELLDSLPVGWQIRRLVTAMKLTSCGRITILENRPLKVGEDLSEGEARVLAQYGWVPNTGLATMLNYCDRVVHDTNKERDGNEWRLKIGRILINGYNGGSVVPKFLQKKLVDDESAQSPQAKQEI